MANAFQDNAFQDNAFQSPHPPVFAGKAVGRHSMWFKKSLDPIPPLLPPDEWGADLSRDNQMALLMAALGVEVS